MLRKLRKPLSLLLTFVMVITSIGLSTIGEVYAANFNEKSYIVTFKNENAKDNYAADSKKKKKVKNNYNRQNSLAVNLTDVEVKELSTVSSIEYIEVDGQVDILSIGKPDRNNNKVRNMKIDTQTIPGE